ncbi:MAG TPA: ester cyclase [Flavobacteriaceae bacterium]|nr:ester cyclase [Flavobacteriaceae bacterium]
MKKLFLLACSVILFTACQQEQRYFSESPEIEALKASISAYESGDWETWKAQFADTATIFHNSNKALSPDESMNQHKAMTDNFSSYGFEDEGSFIEMVIDKDDETWVNYWAVWTGKLKANDKEVRVPVHLTVQYIDGKIVKEYGYYDTAPINNAFAEIEKANNMPLEDKVIDEKINHFITDFFNKKDTSVANELLSSDYVRFINDTKVASGPQELVEYMNAYFTGFSDFNVKILHKSPIFNNTRFVHWQVKGTNDGEFAGNPATGKKIVINGLSRIHFNGDGKIDEENLFFDESGVPQQLADTSN